MAFVTKAFLDRNRQLEMEERRYIVQVKMKWGFLTIYYDGGRDPYLDEIINTAAKMAQQVKKKLDEQYGRGGFRHRTILSPNKS
jgi:multimeric flavodoxin WrbA